MMKKVWLTSWFCISALFIHSMAGCQKGSEINPPDPPIQPSEGDVTNYLTKGDKTKLLSLEPTLKMQKAGSPANPLITIDTTVLYQEIDGFGAAMTGSSAYLLQNKMSPSMRSLVLNRLFDSTAGIGITFVRLTIGASDFSTSEYSYDDVPSGESDFTLQHFSLENGDQEVVPVLQQVVQINPRLKLMASPWSPPAWMKTNNSMRGGKLRNDCYDVYSDYFIRYIQEMKNRGITISAITMQNEPLFATAGYPCMEMQAVDQLDFVKNHLGPKFSANQISTGIILYDHNWDNTQYAISILNDPIAKEYVLGTAFHGYGGDVSAMTTVRNAFPDKGIYFTEISGGTWATNFGDNLMWNMRNIFIGGVINWTKCSLLWNLVLDQNGAPHENDASTCRGVVTLNTSTSQVTYNEEYYSIGHFSKFIRPGARRVGTSIAATLSNLQTVSFLNRNGSKVSVVCNYNESNAVSFTLQQGNRSFDYTLPPKSVITFTWK